MVFELLGRTLLHEIQDRGALEVSETKRCAACLLECLAFVHDEVGVLHTDAGLQRPQARGVMSAAQHLSLIHISEPTRPY